MMYSRFQNPFSFLKIEQAYLLNTLMVIFSILLLFGCELNYSNSSKQFEIEIKSQDSPVNSSLRGISVVDSNLVWLSGANGSILRTMDGGNNWKLINPPDNDSLDFRDVYAFSAQEAIVMSSGFPARVYRTSTAGIKWELVYENLDSSAFLNSVEFKSARKGIILGDQLDGCHLILKTDNGGKSWQRIACNLLPKPLSPENGFAASGACIAVSRGGRFVIGLGGAKSRVYHSNKGIEWQASETTLGGGKSSRGIYALASGASQIIAVGGDYTQIDSSYHVSISKDQGRSWTSGGKVSGYRSTIAFHSPSKLWFTGGSNGLEYSVDQGGSWKKIFKEDINVIHFDKKSKYGWVANKDGKIWRISIN